MKWCLFEVKNASWLFPWTPNEIGSRISGVGSGRERERVVEMKTKEGRRQRRERGTKFDFKWFSWHVLNKQGPRGTQSSSLAKTALSLCLSTYSQFALAVVASAPMCLCMRPSFCAPLRAIVRSRVGLRQSNCPINLRLNATIIYKFIKDFAQKKINFTSTNLLSLLIWKEQHILNKLHFYS